MKRLLFSIFFILLMVLGVSSLLFVLRMMWFPPSSMGMMMGRQTMFHHMFFWLNQTFWIAIMIVGIILLIWVIKEWKRKK
ncbi:hypothetical protein ACQYAD_04105 [Neobacillus sp. SM06]|uniref:hypothetical protein n=1 Tax=Neobacillus sp. SM06 TaxID=3422492 RepID=UPI003D2C21E9